MLDPTLVEKRYQSLVESLDVVSAPRTQLLRILEFLEALLATETYSFLDRHAGDILSRISTIMSRMTLTETSVAVLERLEPVINKLADQCLASSGTETYSRIVDYLGQDVSDLPRGWPSDLQPDASTQSPPTK